MYYICGMFVRKKLNKSGKISIQVIQKLNGRNKVVKTIGCSNNAGVVEKLFIEGKEWINRRSGLQELGFSNHKQELHQFIEGIESLTVIGIEKLLGKLFDEIGFDRIKDQMFRHLVLCRLVYPVSKLKTVDYLSKYHGLCIDINSVYRYMDKLHSKQKEAVQDISYAHTCEVLKEPLNLLFYDVTTLYFEIEQEDDLRKPGFSKDGKHSNPQIVLGLLVTQQGYPVSYSIFEGNKYEGHTLMPVIESFEHKYHVEKLIVVADAGMLSKDNIRELKAHGLEYILGARIKNESEEIKQAILSRELQNGQSCVLLNKENSDRLIVTYSSARAKKDAHNRRKGLDRLKTQIKNGLLTKKHINNRGYNKFLKIENEVKISLNEEMITVDAKWDGLKGYLTNTGLAADFIVESYQNLWNVEKAFRVAKSDLKVRPVYHRAQRRIEAHICITFAAYKIYKELERQLKIKNAGLSPEKAIEIAKTIQKITVTHPLSDHTVSKMLILNPEQQNLANLFDF